MIFSIMISFLLFLLPEEALPSYRFLSWGPRPPPRTFPGVPHSGFCRFFRVFSGAKKTLKNGWVKKRLFSAIFGIFGLSDVNSGPNLMKKEVLGDLFSTFFGSKVALQFLRSFFAFFEQKTKKLEK